MLNPEDRSAIEGLFERLAKVERTADPRDPEAEALIRQEISRQPAAAYYMAQTILVQEAALNMADQRIKELEVQAARRPQSDFFGNLFGGGRNNERVPQPPAPQQRSPWEQEQYSDRRGGGGFLAGAAQTALGVTSGVLLGSAIASMLGAGAAEASEPAPEPSENDQGQDQDSNDFGNNDSAGGDDFGGGDGGFDFGGDF